jgi:UDP-N-acetylmuramoyl-L-alanyl-D-glutamate--2,6-diaminopimelate ligase
VTCLTVGVDPQAMVRGMAGARVPGRMERVQGGRDDEPLGLVDYAHSPEAVDTVLAGLRAGLPGRLVVVLGAGGDRDRAKRPLMGAAAVRHADRVVVTDDNPRGEDPAAIRAGVLTGARREAARHAAEVVEVADRRAAIHAAVRGTGRGDAVVVLGKGHEQGQEVAGRVHPFDDRRVLREALASRPVAREGECRG